LLLALVLAGCGSSDGSPSSAAVEDAATAEATSPASGSATADRPASPGGTATPDSTVTGEGGDVHGVVVTTGGSAYGTVLVDRRRQAIYFFERETGRAPRCYGACAAAWPPVLTDGLPRARGQVRSGLLGTVERRDGSLQVTYAGHPLYFYAHEGPGQLLCHDVVENGGRWLAVSPRGGAAPT
jgi:predicted lipoprotein with Yx(FWY)xxD motif